MQKRRQERGPVVITGRENVSWLPFEIWWGLDREMLGILLGRQLIFSLRHNLVLIPVLCFPVCTAAVLPGLWSPTWQRKSQSINDLPPLPGCSPEGSARAELRGLTCACVCWDFRSLWAPAGVPALTNSAIFAFLEVCKLTLQGYFNWLSAPWKSERQRFCSGLTLTFLGTSRKQTYLCYCSDQRKIMGSSAARISSCCFPTWWPPSDAPTQPGIKGLIHVLVFVYMSLCMHRDQNSTVPK